MVAVDYALSRGQVADAGVSKGIGKGGVMKEEGEAVEGHTGIMDISLRCMGGERRRKVGGRPKAVAVKSIGARRETED
jgi:hypothetical protein